MPRRERKLADANRRLIKMGLSADIAGHVIDQLTTRDGIDAVMSAIVNAEEKATPEEAKAYLLAAIRGDIDPQEEGVPEDFRRRPDRPAPRIIIEADEPPEPPGGIASSGVQYAGSASIRHH